MKKLLAGLFGLAILPGTAFAEDAAMTPLRPDQTTFRALYKELVETNTTLSVGSCTLAAQKMAAHLKAAGYPASDFTVFTAPGHPKEGGLFAVLHGTSKTAKPILLLGHLDVVEAKRADWVRDPFTLIEENNYFYARGTSDMKAMSATWVDDLVRFKQSGYRPRRDIKMALTCGEESSGAFNGAQWLAQNHPDWVSAAFALNEGGAGAPTAMASWWSRPSRWAKRRPRIFVSRPPMPAATAPSPFATMRSINCLKRCSKSAITNSPSK